MGPYLFSAQYRLNTMPKSDRMFIPPYPQYSTDQFPDDPIYYISVDPSTGRSKRHDKTGICVAAVSKSVPDSLFFVEADGYTVEPEQLADLLVDKIVRYKPSRVGIEYGLQAALEPLIRLKMQQRMQGGRFPTPEFWEIKTGGGAGAPNKADKINRTIGALVRDQRAWFLPGMTNLFKQMTFYNPNAQKNDDDILDSAGMMVQTVPYFSPGHWMNGDRRNAERSNWNDFFFPKKRGSIRERLFAS